jgi:hypothetical protein
VPAVAFAVVRNQLRISTLLAFVLYRSVFVALVVIYIAKWFRDLNAVN